MKIINTIKERRLEKRELKDQIDYFVNNIDAQKKELQKQINIFMKAEPSSKEAKEALKTMKDISAYIVEQMESAKQIKEAYKF